MADLPKNLKRLRESKKLSLDSLAQISGISKTHIHRIEQGKQTSITTDTINKLALALETTPRDLAGEVREISPEEAIEVISRAFRIRSPLTEDETVLIEKFRVCRRLERAWVMAFLVNDDVRWENFEKILREASIEDKAHFVDLIDHQKLED